MTDLMDPVGELFLGGGAGDGGYRRMSTADVQFDWAHKQHQQHQHQQHQQLQRHKYGGVSGLSGVDHSSSASTFMVMGTGAVGIVGTALQQGGGSGNDNGASGHGGLSGRNQDFTTAVDIDTNLDRVTVNRHDRRDRSLNFGHEQLQQLQQRQDPQNQQQEVQQQPPSSSSSSVSSAPTATPTLTPTSAPQPLQPPASSSSSTPSPSSSPQTVPQHHHHNHHNHHTQPYTADTTVTSATAALFPPTYNFLSVGHHQAQQFQYIPATRHRYPPQNQNPYHQQSALFQPLPTPNVNDISNSPNTPSINFPTLANGTRQSSPPNDFGHTMKNELQTPSQQLEPTLRSPPTLHRRSQSSAGPAGDTSRQSNAPAGATATPMRSEISVLHQTSATNAGNLLRRSPPKKAQFQASTSSATVTTSAAPSSSAAANAAASKKRSRAEADNSEENKEEHDPERRKRARGRPRLAENKNAETATDRRRTQIRLAQRAFRSRKDKAINDLEGKVQELMTVNEDMSKKFSSFLDFVCGQGALQTNIPEVSHRLQELVKFLLSFRGSDVDDQRTTPPATGPDPSELHNRSRRQTLGAISNVSSENYTTMAPVAVALTATAGLPQVSPAQNAEAFASLQTFHQPEVLSSYEIIAQPTPENASFPSYIPDPHAPGGWVAYEPVIASNVINVSAGANQFAQQSQPIQLSGLTAPAPVPTGLPAPSSYAAQELTFGRRLQRTTLQRGLTLISMANPPPTRLAQVFGFCLLYETRESIIQRLTESVYRPRGQSLFHWRYPFHNLGGAGLNFPDDVPPGELPAGNQGYYQVAKNPHSTGFSIGPFDFRVEAVKDMRLDEKMRMVFPGFEGTYFDADEVEIFLRRRGIHIPGGVDFLDIEIDATDFLDERGSDAPGASGVGTLHQSPPIMTTPTMTSTTLFTAGMASPGAESTQFNPYLGGDLIWPGVTMTKTTLDVNALVNEIIARSVCLGRTPGVQPQDIKRAVRIAAGLAMS